MTTLVLLRHGPTVWNNQHRLQGRTDLPLSAEGRAGVIGWRLPADIAAYRWWCSPLRRARETAELLGEALTERPDIAVELRLMEMSYGEWEGETLEDLRRRHGEQMTQWEARGLDLRPPGGESPRDLQQRLLPWLAVLAQDGGNHFAIVHKGVIRAIYAMATGWTMERKAPDRLAYDCLQAFALDADGNPSVQALNLPLTGSSEAGAAA
jgi:broad specificity phosphatase PhoE